jgi:hypothetical protein
MYVIKIKSEVLKMKTWEISFFEKVNNKYIENIEHKIYIKADSFDEAISKARQVDNRYCAGTVIDF